MATPKTGAKVDAAAWLIRARAKSISARTAKDAYSMDEMRSAEDACLRMN